ncbi:MAG: amylo-alpha-1,6-glucosidase [Candidatus Woesearchaeota archaeon]
MKISHNFRNNIISSDTKKGQEPSFVLSDKLGCYFSLGSKKNVSYYQGMLFPITNDDGWEMHKIIESIYLKNSRISEIKNNLSNIERIGTSFEEFSMPFEKTVLYQVKDSLSPIILELDCRKIYDFNTEGRIYEIEEDDEDKIIKIRYTKFKDSSLNEKDYTLALAIKSLDNNIEIEKTDSWLAKRYSYDDSRSESKEFWIYQALKINIKSNYSTRLLLSAGKDIKEAVKRLKETEENLQEKTDANKRYLEEFYGLRELKKEVPEDIYISYINSIRSFDDLVVKIDETIGIYAGLYWFFQFWSRDEAISTIATIKLEKYALAKDILLRNSENILEDGRIPNRFPHSDLGSADGVGWCFLRLYQLITHLNSKQILYTFFKDTELRKIRDNLVKSIDLLNHKHTEDKLAVSGKKETWIDTSPNDCDNREGARIEIQALRLAMYRFAKKISSILASDEEEKYDDMEYEMKEIVKERFLVDENIADGLLNGNPDMTSRPNIFLAYYIYPELFSKEEWTKAFDQALSKLWLKWGGLSSIDKDSPLFQKYYTGENNLSYHRGDSWFFVNHIAAISMYRLDKAKYMDKINAIIKASMNEILYSGIIGASAEVSSAGKMESKGAWQQAWSSATFIELIKEIWD